MRRNPEKKTQLISTPCTTATSGTETKHFSPLLLGFGLFSQNPRRLKARSKYSECNVPGNQHGPPLVPQPDTGEFSEEAHLGSNESCGVVHSLVRVEKREGQSLCTDFLRTGKRAHIGNGRGATNTQHNGLYVLWRYPTKEIVGIELFKPALILLDRFRYISLPYLGVFALFDRSTCAPSVSCR